MNDTDSYQPIQINQLIDDIIQMDQSIDGAIQMDQSIDGAIQIDQSIDAIQMDQHINYIQKQECQVNINITYNVKHSHL